MITTTFTKIRAKDAKVGDRIAEKDDQNFDFLVDSVCVTKKGKIHLGNTSYNPEQWLFKVTSTDTGMTVEELISILSKQDPKRRVVVRGYEGGVNDIHHVVPVKIQLNANNESYLGKHEVMDEENDSTKNVVDALHLSN